MARKGLLLVAGLGVVAFALILAGRRGRSASSPFGHAPPQNLLLISIDTLRADHLGSYGYAAAQTPVLDSLAARGLRFEHAATVAPLTLPAHSSLMTGTFPAFHGVRDNGGFYLGDDQVTLAKVMRGRGYRTGGFVGAFVLDSRWGIHQGFDRYFDDFDLSKYEGVGMDSVQRRGDEVVAKALDWLGQAPRQPFFCWVHLYDPHTPYEAPEPFRSRFPTTLPGPYDAEIAWTDSLVGRLLERLEADGRLGRTVVVVVGDHGESLGEHREQTHGFFIYDATIHIPLIIVGPEIPPLVIADQVRIVDVMPTVLHLLRVSIPPSVQGQSLLPLVRGEHLGLAALSESWFPRYHYGWAELAAVGDGQYKFVRAPRSELYDLRKDPGETHDVAASQAGRADALGKALAQMLAHVSRAGPLRRPQPVDPDVQERLQALGYVGGSVSAKNLEDRPRGDPKDKIGLVNLLKSAGQSSLEGRIDEAVAKVHQALASDSGIVEAYNMLGNLHAKAQKYDEAVAAYRQALVLDSEDQAAVFGMGLVFKQEGRLDDAEAGFEHARKMDPRNTKALWQLADVWMRRGSFERAETALKEGLEKKADRPSFLLKLGECYIEMKRYAEAESAIERAIAEKADLDTAHYNLALINEARGGAEEAMSEYRAELERNPKAYRASFNLAKLLLKAGRHAEAVARFREAVTSNPEFGTGHLYLAKALLDEGDLPGAEQAARKGLSRSPDAQVAPLGHYVLADVYTRLGRPGAAAREVAAARKIERGG